jgi:hypothetical protein
MMFAVLLRVCIHTGQAEKVAWPRWESKDIDTTGKNVKSYYEICNCTTKSIVYSYYFDTISIV